MLEIPCSCNCNLRLHVDFEKTFRDFGIKIIDKSSGSESEVIFLDENSLDQLWSYIVEKLGAKNEMPNLQ